MREGVSWAFLCDGLWGRVEGGEGGGEKGVRGIEEGRKGGRGGGEGTVHALEDAVDGAGAAAAGHLDVEVVVVRCCCCCCCGGGGGHFFCEWWVFGFGFGFGLYRIGIVGKIDG